MRNTKVRTNASPSNLYAFHSRVVLYSKPFDSREINTSTLFTFSVCISHFSISTWQKYELKLFLPVTRGSNPEAFLSWFFIIMIIRDSGKYVKSSFTKLRLTTPESAKNAEAWTYANHSNPSTGTPFTAELYYNQVIWSKRNKYADFFHLSFSVRKTNFINMTN